MTTDNRTNEPTTEQILVDEWIRQADRAKSMTGMDAIWFPDAEETLAVLRANGLLSEGTPSEEQIERAARAIRADYVQRYPEEPPVYHAGAGQPVWRHMARAALVAAWLKGQCDTTHQNTVRYENLDPEVEKAFRIVQGVLRGLDSGEIVSEPAISALAAEVSTDLNTLTDYLREHHIRITYREDAS